MQSLFLQDCQQNEITQSSAQQQEHKGSKIGSVECAVIGGIDQRTDTEHIDA